MAKQRNISTAKKRNRIIFNVLLVLVLSGALAFECYSGYRLYQLSAEQEQIKEDYSMVNNITFGIFSVDRWRDQISNIVTKKIKGVKITAAQKKEISATVSKELHGMIDKVIGEMTKKQKGLGNKLKKFAFKTFVDPKELHDQVPTFTKIIVDRATGERATNKLKNIATDKFDLLIGQTFDSTQTAIRKVTNHMYAKYRVKDTASFNQQVGAKLANLRHVTHQYAYALLACPLVAILCWVVLRKRPYLHNSLFVLSLLMALAALVVGTTVSIIEVDARMKSLEFILMGERVVFENQVLFFQSKSIVGIADVLIRQTKPDSVTVGILIFLFVMALPMLRIIARGIHLTCRPILAENKVTRYLAFESGKWDMADVMVVGIGMTYIGLNGILDSQLTDLNMKDEFLVTSTVNYTALQPGYIVFIGYVVFGIFLSFMLKQITCNRDSSLSKAH
ncbi:MAG: paraquat-inducible protein A [Pedobacter sp.]|nr:paraquat-inducible protein A [Pedobacter sp.]MDQ8051569.1 paraquat-inducible protein A [Pedobacter sp.]